MLFEPFAIVRAVLFFQPAHDIPLTITIDALREATWRFATAPTLRIAWRFARPVREVRLAQVKSYDASATQPAVRIDVEIESGAALAFEGARVVIGPVREPPPAPIVPSGLLS